MDYFELENNRTELFGKLEERQKILKHLLRDIKKSHYSLTDDAIRISRCKKCFQYYRKKKGTKRWEYLRKEQQSIAEKIVNAEYYLKLQKEIEREIKVIRHWMSGNVAVSMETGYRKLSEGRRVIVRRMYPEQKEFVEGFLKEQYDPSKVFSGNLQYETTSGEWVRSKAEWMIAERLYKSGIPYQYEYPIYLNGLGTVRPDFRCLNTRTRKVILWEHQGMMGDPDYANYALRKLHAYEENGYVIAENLIVTEESAECPLVPATIDRWIQRILE
ncbi:MAG: hypothetical protein IKI01_07870 [Lachnospiraceae bacterium]|nr:hypothetical protein [Lachnospiraceae bacterium]